MTGITVASWILGSVLVVMTLLFIFRIVLTWYPGVNLSKLPLSLIAWPTDGGVDITPIIWVGICSLLREMMLGQQGILTMMM
ncbi:MAG: YggT family protein [Oscillatoriales cyanobacterium]|nr:MAG: YggT family protein [Oscillatoriales cyanobacterium]